MYTHLRSVASAFRGAAPVAVAVGVAGSLSTAKASDDHIAPPAQPWHHQKFLGSQDAAALRRGFQVYTQVCATCHSLKRVAWRNFVGTIFSEEQAKWLAAQKEYVDGPNEDGEMFERPGKLSDYLPSPYENEEQARAINNGALPPDLSLVVKARHDGENYLFSLLTGYRDAPHGVEVDENAGQYYNPYFAGGKIGMAKQLVDGMLEYDDGTPATEAQMAKDVTEFLAWAAEPDHNERRSMGLKFMLFMAAVCASAGYYKRFRWTPIKNRKITYTPLRK